MPEQQHRLLCDIKHFVRGTTCEEYVEKRIFEPLGMKRSMYCNNSENIPRRAYGYGLRNGLTRRVPEIVHTGTYAAGALCSTAEDLITWLQGLHGGKVLTPKSYSEMITPSTLMDGTRRDRAGHQSLPQADRPPGRRYVVEPGSRGAGVTIRS